MPSVHSVKTLLWPLDEQRSAHSLQPLRAVLPLPPELHPCNMPSSSAACPRRVAISYSSRTPRRSPSARPPAGPPPSATPHDRPVQRRHQQMSPAFLPEAFFAFREVIK